MLSHKQLENAVSDILQKHFGNKIRIYGLENVGAVINGRYVFGGIKGAGDLMVILNHRGYPLHLEIEVKGKSKTLRPSQKRRKKILSNLGAFYQVLDNSNYKSIIKIIEDYLGGIDEQNGLS